MATAMHINNVRLREYAEPARHLLEGLGGLTHAESCAVAVKPLVGLHIP